MLFAIYCLDGPGQAQRRLDHHPDHRAYLTAFGGGLIVAGPLLADDLSRSIGSLFLLEAASREEAQRYIDGDPFRVLGIWETVTIHPFEKRTDRREDAAATE